MTASVSSEGRMGSGSIVIVTMQNRTLLGGGG